MKYRILKWEEQSGSEVEVKEFPDDAGAASYLQTLGDYYTAEVQETDGAIRIITALAA